MRPLFEKKGLGFFWVDEPGIDASLDAVIRQSLVECFPADKEAFSKCSWWHSRPEWRIIAMDAEEKIVAHVAIVVRKVTAGKDDVVVAGIQSVFIVPAYRGEGISDTLLISAMDEAKQRGNDFGILFCIKELEKVYVRSGWQTIDAAVSMIDGTNAKVPIPGKNIAMIYPLIKNIFPSGDVCLNGLDW